MERERISGEDFSVQYQYVDVIKQAAVDIGSLFSVSLMSEHWSVSFLVPQRLFTYWDVVSSLAR